MSEVTIAAAAGALVEGAEIQFTVAATPAPAADLTVNVRVRESGAVLEAAPPQMVTVAVEQTMATLTVATVDDVDQEPASTVTATVIEGSGYGVGSPASAAVTVADNDAPEPEVTITAGTNPVPEGTAAVFTLAAQRAPASDLVVNVSVTETGVTLAGTVPRTVTIPAGRALATLSVATVDDVEDEPDSTLTAVVTEGDGDTPGTPASAEVVVTDDDGPVPVVTIAAVESEVSAGPAEFSVTADPAPASDLMVQVRLTVTPAAYAQTVTVGPGETAAVVSIPAGETIATLTVNTDPGHVVSAALQAGIGYEIGDTAPVEVTVREPKSEVTIAAAVTSATEGAVLEFTLGAEPAPAADLTVNVTVDETGSMLPASRPQSLTIAAGAMSAALTLTTVDDASNESDSTVTVTLTEGTGYTLGMESTASVTVTDDDEPAPEQPQVTISRVASSVTEGTAVQFRVTAEPAPVADLRVNVTVEETGIMLAGAPPATVTIAAGAGTATLTVNTAGDGDDEPDSTVTARITGVSGGGLEYRVGSPGSASVTVTDDDEPAPPPPPPPPPQVTISAGTSPVTEGTAVQFTVTANPAPAASLAVNVTWSDPGSKLSGSPSGTVTIPTSGSATLTADTDDDATDESDSSVTATVQAGTGYSVGSPNSASVTVRDNDDPAQDQTPVVRFDRADPNPVAEGGTVRIYLTATPAPKAALDVFINIMDSELGSVDGRNARFHAGESTDDFPHLVEDTDAPTSGRTVTLSAYGCSPSDGCTGLPATLTVSVTDVN